jgi:hypothetical protein
VLLLEMLVYYLNLFLCKLHVHANTMLYIAMPILFMSYSVASHFLSLQGTYVEGIKEEVVLSPGHALSFIAAGEGYYIIWF